MTLPAAWRELNANQRDILLALALDGPASGRGIFDRVGNVAGHQREMSTYRNLKPLEERGLLTRRERDGREDEYDLPDDGNKLVDSFRAAVC